MPSRRAHAGAGGRARCALPAVLLALAVAGCTAGPAAEPDRAATPATTLAALPARAVTAGRWSVDFRLTTSPPASRARRVFGGSWQETVALAPDGRLQVLTVVPAAAWLSDLPAEAPRSQPVAVPAALEVRRAEDGRSLALGIRVGNLPPAEAELWRARLTTLLFFEEILEACLPAAGSTATEWPVELDAAAFLARSRFGAWPAPVSLRGKAGRPAAAANASGRGHLVGVIEVRDAVANTWRMSVDAVFGSAPAILESAVILGAATQLPEPQAAGALTGEFEWRLRRSPAAP